jgi:site-specific DNA-methyltransferase (adenine-specific)
VSIEIRCCSATDLIASLEPGSVDAVIADPPWSYARGVGVGGGAQDEYSGLSEGAIASDCRAAMARMGLGYLALWATWPKIGAWIEAFGPPLTGACWGKVGGLGVGYHFRGDSEPLLLYRKGNPRPLEGSKSNLWLHPRLGHSEKPPNALEALVRMSCPEDGLVLDPYAGESASLAKVCRRLGRRYVGAEIDPERHARALRRLAGESRKQAAMVGQESLFG